MQLNKVRYQSELYEGIVYRISFVVFKIIKERAKIKICNMEKYFLNYILLFKMIKLHPLLYLLLHVCVALFLVYKKNISFALQKKISVQYSYFMDSICCYNESCKRTSEHYFCDNGLQENVII